MKQLTVGVVDYGIGNHGSMVHALRKLGFWVRLSRDVPVLNEADVLLLPGVGAFPTAMQHLHSSGLASYLQDQAIKQRPVIGICLGMQLLASASYEHQLTAGLDLIPGKIGPLEGLKCHIGWNTIKCLNDDELFRLSNKQAFYFNHSFGYFGATENILALADSSYTIPAVIRRGNIIGLQFHPEKSQAAGRLLLENVIKGLCYA